MKIFIIIFVLTVSIFAKDQSNTHLITEKDLQGTWVKISWNKSVRDLFKFMDLNEKKFESIQFAGKYYLYNRSDKEHLYNKDKKIYNSYSFKLKTDKQNKQWLGLKNGSQIMGFNKPSRWVYWGISKITKALTSPKKIKKLVDFQLGDIVLTLYNSKTKKIVYRKQFRKIIEK